MARAGPNVAFPWFEANFRSDPAVKALTAEEREYYRVLLCHQWHHGPLLAQNCSNLLVILENVRRSKSEKIWKRLAQFFPQCADNPAFLAHPKVERLWQNRERYVQQQQIKSGLGVAARRRAKAASVGEPAGQPVGHGNGRPAGDPRVGDTYQPPGPPTSTSSIELLGSRKTANLGPRPAAGPLGRGPRRPLDRTSTPADRPVDSPARYTPPAVPPTEIARGANPGGWRDVLAGDPPEVP